MRSKQQPQGLAATTHVKIILVHAKASHSLNSTEESLGDMMRHPQGHPLLISKCLRGLPTSTPNSFQLSSQAQDGIPQVIIQVVRSLLPPRGIWI